jgi:hypothetical protein
MGRAWSTTAHKGIAMDGVCGKHEKRGICIGCGGLTQPGANSTSSCINSSRCLGTAWIRVLVAEATAKGREYVTILLKEGWQTTDACWLKRGQSEWRMAGNKTGDDEGKWLA